MKRVSIAELEELTGTDFFQFLSRFESYDLVEENMLSDAYMEFHKSVVNLCINSYAGTPAYFVLKYVRIELCQLEQCFSGEKKKSVNMPLSQKRYAGSGVCTRLAV